MSNFGDCGLRVVIFREAHLWLAQGLEHDLGAQAPNLRELVNRLAAAIEHHRANGGLDRLGEAPVYFQALWPARGGMLAAENGGALDTAAGKPVRLAMVA